MGAEYIDWFYHGACTVVVLALAGCVARAYRRDLLNGRATVAATVFWILLLFLVMPGFLYFRSDLNTFREDPDGRRFVVAAAILGIAPFATLPLVMQWARHR